MSAPVLRCACGYVADCHGPAPLNGTRRDAVPSTGSLTFCLKCARVYVLTEVFGWQPFDVDTLDPALRAEVRRMQSAIHQVGRIPS